MAIYTEKGTIRHLGDVQEGVSRRGLQWKRREFVIDVQEGNYINQLHFGAFNEDAALLDGAKVGTQVEVKFRPTARPYNDRWYNELALVSLTVISQEKNEEDSPQPEQQELSFADSPKTQKAQKPAAATTSVQQDDEDDDLPFL